MKGDIIIFLPNASLLEQRTEMLAYQLENEMAKLTISGHHVLLTLREVQ